MGKNHRHSKKLKSEKNKVHIKTKTKFLPKGQNVTSTVFKIKQIVLPQQLKERQESSSSLANKKNANIDELVSKLKHFNDTIKTESCQDLRDLISSNSLESVQIYLSAILQNGSALVQDRERKVRRAAIKLLQTVFEKMSPTALRPFFGYILTNLKCAMTNINKHIQEDSLLLLDAILENQSRLIAESFSDFFPNFLTLISKLKTNSNERSLSLNLEGKVTSVKWRVKVLTRLYGILNALIESPQRSAERNLTINVEAEGKVFIPIYKDISIFENIDSVVSNKTTSPDVNFDGYVSTLMQLLYAIWIEIIPEKNKNSENTIFTTEEAVSIFICVVNILKLLQQLGKGTVFADSKSLSFLDSLMSNFPYSHNRKKLEIAKDFPKCFTLNHDPHLVEENLTIVHIFISLRVKNTKNSPRHKSMLSYIENCLRPNFRLGPLTVTLLGKILREILFTDRTLSRKLGINEAELMDSVADLYTSGKLSENFKFEILEILTSSRLQRHQWMEQLADFLCEKRVSGKLVEAVWDLCRKGEGVVQASVRRSLGRILGNLPNLEIVGVEPGDPVWRTLASVFFYIPDLDKEELELIRNFSDSYAELPVSKHLRNVLDLRSNNC